MFTLRRAGMRLLEREAPLYDLVVREGCVQDMAELGVVRFHDEIEKETQRVFFLLFFGTFYFRHVVWYYVWYILLRQLYIDVVGSLKPNNCSC